MQHLFQSSHFVQCIVVVVAGVKMYKLPNALMTFWLPLENYAFYQKNGRDKKFCRGIEHLITKSVSAIVFRFIFSLVFNNFSHATFMHCTNFEIWSRRCIKLEIMVKQQVCPMLTSTFAFYTYHQIPPIKYQKIIAAAVKIQSF